MRKAGSEIGRVAGSSLGLKVLVLLPLFLSPLFSLLCSSAVITVSPGESIQAAINAATGGDEIIVSPGTYVENINFGGRSIILRSIDPTRPSVVADTVIDGNGAGSVVTFSGTESSSCALSGFTIRNGYRAWGHGGGVCGNGTRATIRNNLITNNFLAGWYAGGSGVYDCDGTIQNNVILGNTAINTADSYGGGLCFCDGTIENNMISDNAAASGGGLAGCHGTIQNNVISADNFAYSSGGGLWWCNGTIQNNTISGNTAGISGGGLYVCGGTIQNNTISSNWAASGGGGLGDCNGTIQSNIIYGNFAHVGGGLCRCNDTVQKNTITSNTASYGGGGLAGCNGTVQNNAISGNTAGTRGGGLYVCEGTIQNNVISGNTAGSEGGGLNGSSSGVIRNNTIYGNSAAAGGGVCDCHVRIQNCIIWRNMAPEGAQTYWSGPISYSCIEGSAGGGTGNISSDPLLVDPASGDFHLQVGSPCIDAGRLVDGLTSDFEGHPRPLNGTGEPRGDGSDYDIGADEYVPLAASTNWWLFR